MSGIDDNVAIIRDWLPPSPSSRAFFSTILGDDIKSRTIPELPRENRTNLPPFSEQKSSSRGGLVERMAARAGFNAPRLNTESIRSAEVSSSPDIRSPYLTIPPGLSPTTLLDSPVFLSNSLAQPSPTTGKFSYMPNSNIKNSALTSESADKSKDNFFDDINGSSFAFKPVPDSRSSFFLSANKHSFPSIEVSVQSESSHGVEPNQVHFTEDFSRPTFAKERRAFDANSGNAELSPPLDELQDDEGEQKGSGGTGTPSEDGYNWRKYGQKQVKGSEYPRSYYKCTQPNCQVKKKVERSHEGHITEIIYKGAHNHPKPTPNRRSGSANTLDAPYQVGIQSCVDNDPVWTGAQKRTPEWRNDNVEVTSAGQNGTHFESGDVVDASSTFSNDEDEDDRATHGSVGYEGEGDESESKRRKIENYPTEIGGATRAIREPRVVVQTTSEVDILDDGYRWRKYGQKVVKGNPNPRSYYKCTNAGCTVRKHVERASHDLKSVITTYEGKHNHDVPAARNSSHVNSSGNTQAGMAVHKPEPAQVHNSVPRFERPGGYGSYGLVGPTPSFSYGMNQSGLANLAMPVMPSHHPYLAQQRQMGFVLPKGEPMMEVVSEPTLDLPGNSSVYQQIMSRLPLGPQM